jgi:hypothetical protein
MKAITQFKRELVELLKKHDATVKTQEIYSNDRCVGVAHYFEVDGEAIELSELEGKKKRKA